MPYGTVVSFDTTSGFGYLTADGGGQLFVDFTALLGKDALLRAGQRVVFQITKGVMGLHATSVRSTTVLAPIA